MSAERNKREGSSDIIQVTGLRVCYRRQLITGTWEFTPHFLHKIITLLTCLVLMKILGTIKEFHKQKRHQTLMFVQILPCLICIFWVQKCLDEILTPSINEKPDIEEKARKMDDIQTRPEDI